MRASSRYPRRGGGAALTLIVLVVCLALSAGAAMVIFVTDHHAREGTGRLDKIWGRRGISEGRLHKPRAIAIDQNDRIYLVDMTARIQVFDSDGNFSHLWQTPDSDNGKPSGLSIDRDGNLLVADTHYYRVLIYSPAGELLAHRTIGGDLGQGPGEFGFVTDAVQDSAGNYYVSEYGEHDRIQKFSRDGNFLLQWGSHGGEKGQFLRPQNLAIDDRDYLWVADACNHRIQVFDATGSEARLVDVWGEEGTELGKLKYPYDLVVDDEGYVYVCEFGNHRVQKFTRDGQLVGYWGNVGRDPGQLHNPWALVRDRRGLLHVLDTYNHRVQRVRL